MDISLDDYIAKNANSIVTLNANKTKMESSFKAERRQNECIFLDEDEQEEGPEAVGCSYDAEDVLMVDAVEEQKSIWKGPSSKTCYLDFDNSRDAVDNGNWQMKPQVPNNQHFDLRKKINGTAVNMPKLNSQNWRMMQPNVMSRRPAGMPPLVPQKTLQQQCHRRQGQNNYNNNGQNRGCEGNNNTDPNSGFEHSLNNNWRGKRNNKKINQQAKYHKKAMQHLVSNGPMSVGRQDPNFNITFPTKMLTAPAGPPKQIVDQSGNGLTRCINGFDFNEMKNTNNYENNGQSKSIKDLLGFGNRKLNDEMMPMIASKLLDFLQQGVQTTTHKPIYDMNVHKAINEIQVNI